MRIGTLTFHRAHNYGGVLQSYALVKFLQLKGYNAEIADYRCPQIEAVYKIWKMDSIKSLLKSLINFPKNIRAYKNFKRFRNQCMTISKLVYRKPEDFSNQYDVCIMGSDQVWTPRLVGENNPIYYGNFARNIRKIGYAVSVAEISYYSSEVLKSMAEHVKNFSHFSTREESFGIEMKRLSGRDVVTVLDPSLLLTKEDYEQIVENPKEIDYILYYQQEYHPLTKTIIERVARQMKASMIIIVTGKEEKYDYPYKYYSKSTLSVNKFLGLIKNAKFVFTSSFHGTAYSLIFRKDFYFVANAAPDRARNLLIKCGAEDRLINSTDSVQFSKVDYSKVEPKLNAARQQSIDWLIKAIENK